MKLSECVAIERQFQRSVRVDTDVGRVEALKGYVCHSSARYALATMAQQFKQSGQRAFTWTGPFGGGKSSLAVVLATLLGGGSSERRMAADAIGKQAADLVRKSLSATTEPWLVVPLVGHKADLVESLRKGLGAHGPRNIQRQLQAAKSNRDLVGVLTSLSKDRPKSGVLIVFDELGKFLEHAAGTDGDIHFLQDLAEAAGRAKGRLLILGILHQTFEQYAVRLGHSHRDEWAKIQGRFVDIPLIAALDEIVDLTGRAISTVCKHEWSKPLARAVAHSIAARRPGAPRDLPGRLDACWPLHPATAALLGPASKRRFGQNERSTFGFLSSAEPLGFTEFLRSTDVESKKLYEPSIYWDYLRTNLEPAILASPDGHRWSLALDAVERCTAKGTPLHARLIKSIAVLDIFRNGSGISSDRLTLNACLPDVPAAKIGALLRDLEKWSVAVYRKHLDSWAIFSGSDFDIESAVRAVLNRGVSLKLSELTELAGLAPIVAKRLYYETGTLRWFHTEMCDLEGLRNRIGSFRTTDGSAGLFLLILPTNGEPAKAVEEVCRELSGSAKDYPVTLGIPSNAERIIDFASELVALELAKRERPELDGDPVARRELVARMGDVSARLEDELRSALFNARWFVEGESRKLDKSGVAGLATTVAKKLFPFTPVVRSEMANRHRPSSNTQAAVRQLLWAMVKNPQNERLGLTGFSAERGLYSTTLEVLGLHGVSESNHWMFHTPKAGMHQQALVEMWAAAERLLAARSSPITISDLYDTWRDRPFGIRQGLLPIFGLAFALSNIGRLAIYRQGVYQPDVNEVLADVLLQDPSLVALRLVSKDAQYAELVGALQKATENGLGISVSQEPLEIARALVGFVFGLTPWARRTTALSNHAQAIRRLLLDANDPQKLLFVDLPMVFGIVEPSLIAQRLGDALRELKFAYEEMLRDIEKRMLSALGACVGDWNELRRRAEGLVGATGDLRLDAFAVRLSTFGGNLEEVEGIVSMAVNRPPRDWSDRDPDAAALELASLALRFRQAEVLVAVKGRAPTRKAIGLVIGTGEMGRTSSVSFDVADSDLERIQKLADKVLQELVKTGLPANVLLASIAEAGGELMRKVNGGHHE